jgi:hypothetical protein
MPLYDLNEFIRLSEAINLQLSVKAIGSSNIASIITDRHILSRSETDIMMKVLSYLGRAYGVRRRRLGPLAVLHPLRATTLMARAETNLRLLNLLTCLLHDKLEDLTSQSLGQQHWQALEDDFVALIKSIDPEDEWFLMERLDWLSRHDGETYFSYIGRLLDNAGDTPELIAIKLADRLDNTLDLQIYVEDPIQHVDFFKDIFQLVFDNSDIELEAEVDNSPAGPLNGAARLYQLFKSAVLMSMIRQRGLVLDNTTAQVLFDALATASMKEAQRVILHIFKYHILSSRERRQLVMEVLKYAQQGGLGHTTLPNLEHRLDGLFVSIFNDSDRQMRKKSLDFLFQDKSLMIEAALAFVAMFLRFSWDPNFYVKGISEQGVSPTS